MDKICLGKHLIIDYYKCSKDVVNSREAIKDLIHCIADEIKVTIVKEEYHNFEPIGITGFAIVSESHISIHTWPEHDYLGIDIFSCKEFNLDMVLKLLKEKLYSDRFDYRIIDRETIV